MDERGKSNSPKDTYTAIKVDRRCTLPPLLTVPDSDDGHFYRCKQLDTLKSTYHDCPPVARDFSFLSFRRFFRFFLLSRLALLQDPEAKVLDPHCN